MLLNYDHSEIDAIIECELEYQPADPENIYWGEDFELVSAKINGVDIAPILNAFVIAQIKEQAFAVNG